jgi:hypothetical protein
MVVEEMELQRDFAVVHLLYTVVVGYEKLQHNVTVEGEDVDVVFHVELVLVKMYLIHLNHHLIYF